MKKYIVRLTDKQRSELKAIIKKNDGSAQKIRRAWVLLKSDQDGPAWSDSMIAQAYDCSTTAVAHIRQHFVERGLLETINGQPKKGRNRVLDGKQEAKVIALRLGTPPEGYSQWTLRLLRDKVIELGIAPSISHQTIGRILKKRNDSSKDRLLGNSSKTER